MATGVEQQSFPFWSLPGAEVLGRLRAAPGGLSGTEAEARTRRYATRRLAPKRRTDTVALLLKQFSNPIVLLLLAATAISVFLHDTTDAVIIFIIVLLSGLLSFWQERGAAGAVEKLLSLVEAKARVLRDGAPIDIPVAAVVPGDVLLFAAGATVPADCLVLEARDLFVDEATLTGETFPVEKLVGVLPPDTPLAKRANALFMGTHVVSGAATALTIAIGRDTEFGRVSDRLQIRPPETEFERGLHRFGDLLLEVTLLMVIGIFGFNVYLHRPALDSFLFAMALAVGLTPQLLPAIISSNLAHGARRMAGRKVIVKRLNSIENFGSMNVLCTDKTGTITQGSVRLLGANDLNGEPSDRVALYALVNATFETGFASPIDAAVRDCSRMDISAWTKLDEVPYDFVRKRLSILASGPEGALMITKGALTQVLEVCTTAEDAAGGRVPVDRVRERIEAQYARYSGQGYRALGVACKRLGSGATISKESEADMSFLGFLVFSDPPKPGIETTVERLRALGVNLKVITGDSALVAATVAREVGLGTAQVLTGPELHRMSDEALLVQAGKVEVFAEVEPNQKERIIRTLRRAGHVVGYMGDGINDVSALHAADVGISVDTAVDVAKEVADIVLLEKDLDVLLEGVRDGRSTFANTLKYVQMAISANFGTMFSMAGASLLLPFLPLLPKQILLTNLLTDAPEMTIASDSVDPEMLERPRRWDIGFIRSFMVVFGLLSSVFDYLTFGALLLFLHAGTDQFRTGWFMESVISASLVVLVIRSRRPFYRSRPGTGLLWATIGVVAATLLLPLLPFAKLMGFARLPAVFFGMVAAIVVLYLVSAEAAKQFFYRARAAARA